MTHRAVIKVAGALLLIALVASGAAAQGAPGRIVQAGDGTLYLLKDGARFAIVAEPVGDEELEAYADGGTLDAAQLPNAIVAAAPTLPVAAVEAPAAEMPPAEPAAQAPPAEAPAAAPPAAAPPAEPAPPGTGARRGVPGTGTPAAPPPAAGPHFVAVQGNTPGRAASVTVQAEPGASCSLSFTAPGPTRAPTSLGQQSAGASGQVTWSFPIDAATPQGTGTVTATCGSATFSSPIRIGDALSR
jgi:hypothetical protein